MSRLIDADKFKKDNEELLNCDFPYLAEDTLEDLIDSAPTVDAEPIRHGHWVYIDDGDERYATYRCSHCHKEVTVDAERICDIGFVIEDFERCLRCGAKMDEVTE